MCGDYSAWSRLPACILGSPPRVWGLRSWRIASFLSLRITPTCVGTTRLLSALLLLSRDHPHVCGDYGELTTLGMRVLGSPPRVWGLLIGQCRLLAASGITPTCVGTTSSIRRVNSVIRDHPHVCGDYSVHRVLFTVVLGSPPRVWGLPDDSLCSVSDEGITPTCVGTTPAPPRPPPTPWDHPHVCGDYQTTTTPSREAQGSPPRVWGLLLDDGDVLVASGITPTCVGTTCSHTSGDPGSGDHPHVCGDYLCSCS